MLLAQIGGLLPSTAGWTTQWPAVRITLRLREVTTVAEQLPSWVPKAMKRMPCSRWG